MAELTQAAEVVCTPRSLLGTLLNWLAFFFQIFVRFLRALGYHPLLSSSSSSPPHDFKPLPAVELPEIDFPGTLEIAAGEESAAAAATADGCLQKLTVVLDLDETLVCAYETSSLPASLQSSLCCLITKRSRKTRCLIRAY